jgi:MinD-like ATPase involved in chromosome partitioning or flagellar assembly
MTVTVLTAVVGPQEAPLVSGLEGSKSGVHVVRRCADLGELLSAANAGLARAVILSADLQRLDRAAVSQLTSVGVAVVGLVAPSDPAAAERLVNLGVRQVLPADTPTELIAEAITAAVAELTRNPASVQRARLDLADPGAALPVMPSVDPVSPSPRGRANGRIVTVWGPVGSPGRTTVAVTLAAEFATAMEVLLVDADTYGASIAQSLGLLDESAGLAAAARAANNGGFDLLRLAQLAPPVTGRLRVLTGLPQSRRWPELRPSALDEVWKHARELALWTVVDTGFGLEADEELMFDTAAPRRNGATLSALSAADVVLGVGSADPIGLQRLLSGLHDLTEVVPAGVPVKVVVTRVRDSAVGGSAEHLVRSALERYAGVTDAVLVPDDRPALDAVMLLGRSLTEAAPTSPARQAIAELARNLSSEAGLPHGASTRKQRRPGSRRRLIHRLRRTA